MVGGCCLGVGRIEKTTFSESHRCSAIVSTNNPTSNFLFQISRSSPSGFRTHVCGRGVFTLSIVLTFCNQPIGLGVFLSDCTFPESQSHENQQVELLSPRLHKRLILLRFSKTRDVPVANMCVTDFEEGQW